MSLWLNQDSPEAAAKRSVLIDSTQRDIRNSLNEPRSPLLSTQQGTWVSCVERNVDWRRDPEVVREKMRQERSGVRRERRIESGKVFDVGSIQ